MMAGKDRSACRACLPVALALGLGLAPAGCVAPEAALHAGGAADLAGDELPMGATGLGRAQAPRSATKAGPAGGAGAGTPAAVAGSPGAPLTAVGVGDSGFGVQFRKAGRKVQAVSGVNFEIRAMYTEAVVRSVADLADYHVGVKALPNSLTGYSLNLPAPGSVAGTAVPRLRYAQHTVNDDPLFIDLADASRALNPTTDPGVYFLGQGILRTGHGNGFPPQVADPFLLFVNSIAVGSLDDLQGAKLSMANAEALFSALWMSGVTYTAGSAFPLVAAVQDRPLTDNATITNTRYYKWRFPFSATAFSLGMGLPLGRLVFDIRVLDAADGVTAWGAAQLLLQPGANAMVVTIYETTRGLGAIDFSLPK